MNKEHEHKAAARFDKWANTYGDDRLSRWFRYYQLRTLSHLKLQADDIFLDVGCGTGAGVREAATMVTQGRAYGIDISPQMIERAKMLSCNISNTQFKIASANLTPFPNQYFDKIMCTCSFHHYNEPRASLLEIRRILKPGGIFALLESARDLSLSNWLQDRFRRYFERSHVQYYTRQELKLLLDHASFTIRKQEDYLANFEHGKLFTRLTLFLAHRPRMD